MVSENELTTKLERLKSVIPKSEWKYYFLPSIENFIYHLKSFESERTRQKMEDQLNDYLDILPKTVQEDSRVSKTTCSRNLEDFTLI
jgi:hypothetical protein